MGDLALARDIILRHGWNATAYQILNPGIGLWFARDRDAVAGYRDWGGVRVIAGAPVCAEGRLEAVARELEAEASGRGLSICYFAAGERLEGLLGAKGHARAAIGSQPVWEPARWGGILAAQATLRAQLARARNKGVTVEERRPAASARDAELARCLREWIEARRMPPMGFLVEPRTLERLWDRRIFVAVREGRAVGFLIASPVPARRGWLIEQIVRGKSAPNGTAELLLDAAFLQAAASGVEYFTLGLAPLARLDGSRALPGWLALLFRWTRAHGGRFYNFRGLEAFKAKFRPSRWEPLYALCNRPEFRLRDLLAIAGAFGGSSPWVFLGRALLLAGRQEAAWLWARLRRRR